MIKHRMCEPRRASSIISPKILSESERITGSDTERYCKLFP